ncbi:MAG: hypothetical protein ACRDPX_13395 [Gaiellaceae bacterium]
MDGDGGIRRRHTRLLVVGAVAALATFFAAEPAFAQLPLGSEQNGAGMVNVIVGTVTQALPTGQVIGPVLQEGSEPVAAVTQPLAQATAPVAQTTEPVAATTAETAAPVVAQVAAPITQAAAPVVAQVTAPVAQVVDPVVQQAAGPMLTAVQPIVQTAAPVLAAAQPVLEAAEPLTAPLLAATAPLLDTAGAVLEATAPLLETTTEAQASSSSPATAPTSASGASNAPSENAAAQPTSTSAAGTVTPALVVAADGARPPASREGGAVATGPRREATAAIEPSSLWPQAYGATRADRKAHTAKAGSSRTPAPTGPSGPFGFLTSVSAAPGSGALLVFFAALAAIILVAAPGLGRRLRPDMAPWPLPITLASLERPG